MMQDHLQRHPSLRLQGYDYSQAGMYFITIVTQNRLHLFGEISNCEMHLNQYGRIVKWVWSDLPLHYSNLELSAFVVMPNHVHGIVILHDTRRGGSVLANLPEPISTNLDKDTRLETLKTHPYGKTQGLSEIVRALKSFSARRINKIRGTPGASVWQRGYYDHIICNQDDLELTWQYIDSNPAQWSADEENLPRLPTGEGRGPSS